MFLQYFKKKENTYKIKAEKTYAQILSYTKELNNKFFFNNINFDTSFEITTIILILYLKEFKEKKEDKYYKINDFLVQIFINDLDHSFRRIGIGDMSIGKYVKKYVKKYYFRIKQLDSIILDSKTVEFDEYLKNIKDINKENIITISKKIKKILYEIKKSEDSG
jgi:cytochrome b pre-mRNA-processing protein 3